MATGMSKAVIAKEKQAAPDAEDVRLNFWQKLMVGGVAGVVGSAIIFPVDTVKSLLMAQKPRADGSLQYSGPLDAARQVIAKGGARSLYSGLRANLIGVTPEKAIKLGVNDWMRDQFAVMNRKSGVVGNAGDGLFTWQAIVCGSTAGTVQCIATNPMEIVKIRMQLGAQAAVAEGAKAEPLGLVETVRGLGLRGLYRGSAATLMRDIPFSALFFPMYGALKPVLTSDSRGAARSLGPLVAGMISGAASAAIFTPMDVIKTRLQAKGGSAKYKGIADCFRQTLAAEGLAALYHGWLPRAMVVGPLFGISLLAFEVFKAVLRAQKRTAAAASQ